MLSSDVEPFVICEAHQKGVNWVDFHPVKKLFATCSDDKLVKLFSYSGINANEIYAFTNHTGNINCVKFSSCGKYLYTCGEDFQFWVFDLDSYKSTVIYTYD